jgi:hypothetical protein
LDPWQQGLFLVSLDDKPPKSKSQEKSPDYYANVGDAIRTLREDIPKLFEEDLNCKYLFLADGTAATIKNPLSAARIGVVG